MSALGNKLLNFFRRDDGTQMIEFAIVFPILLLLFAGTAELGRLFYTYTTLAKATRGGARYLSLVADVNASTTAGKNMVMCGNSAGCGGNGQPAVILPTVDKPASRAGASHIHWARSVNESWMVCITESPSSSDAIPPHADSKSRCFKSGGAGE